MDESADLWELGGGPAPAPPSEEWTSPEPLRAVPLAAARIRAKRRLLLLDSFSTLAGLAAAALALAGTGTAAWRSGWILVLALPAVLSAFAWHGMYRGSGLRAVPSGLSVLTPVLRAGPFVLIAVLALLSVGASTRGLALVGLAAAATAPILLAVLVGRSLANVVRASALRARNQRVLIVGCGEAADLVASRMERHGGIDVIGMVDESTPPGFETIGTVGDVPRLCADLAVDRIVVALPTAQWNVVSETLQPLIGRVEICIVPSLYELMTWRSGVGDVAGLPLIPLAPAQAGLAGRTAKRALDVVVASLALVVLSPVLLAAALAVRISSRGPVIFRQARAGLHDETFTILKFRTMQTDAEDVRTQLVDRSDADGPRFKMANDPRVTRVGTFLRHYSIDELPQLLNVLSGSMSLVGPRPFPLVESGAFHVGSAVARFEMKPGMTGLWQVSGRSDLSWDDLCRLDAIYVRSWSLLWDLRILVQTPVVALRRQGAY